MNGKGMYFNEISNLYQSSIQLAVIEKINYIIITLSRDILDLGESNGKLPPRTCPECSVPEQYRSHDWALVPANPASKAEY
jgi:hypothetical protein